MQTTVLIKIEDIKSAPYQFEAGDLDYSLMPELNNYIEKYGQKGIDKIKEFMLYTVSEIQRSYDYKHNPDCKFPEKSCVHKKDDKCNRKSCDCPFE